MSINIVKHLIYFGSKAVTCVLHVEEENGHQFYFCNA
jgi:hypothetical protein